MKREIKELEDIHQLVDSFYEKVRADELLGPIFNGVIRDRWPLHLQKMYTFWQTVLLKEHTYNGRPFPPHYQLPVDARHFDHWLKMFSDTIDEHFTGEKAEEAKWRAKQMAEMFQYKIAYFRERNSGPLV